MNVVHGVVGMLIAHGKVSARGGRRRGGGGGTYSASCGRSTDSICETKTSDTYLRIGRSILRDYGLFPRREMKELERMPKYKNVTM